MRRSGRVNWILVFAVLAIIIFTVPILMSGKSPEAVASDFLSALATGDVDTLTKLSYLEKSSPEEIHKQWEFATKEVAPHYLFIWTIKSSSTTSDKNAVVVLDVERNLDTGASYPERFELPMVKRDGHWLVDVIGISRDMYPGMPR